MPASASRNRSSVTAAAGASAVASRSEKPRRASSTPSVAPHRDRPLERLAVRSGPSACCAGVEEDEPARAPGGLVLADHELAGAGHRRPVDPPQVVALLVAAHRVELLARAEQLPRAGGAEARPDGGVGPPSEVLDLRA